ncbi:hypothetical protein DIPPA_16228 [Diplonema papillatum]|nr:hypothetical protein DIPPA_16228 [Diplonema papillatum]
MSAGRVGEAFGGTLKEQVERLRDEVLRLRRPSLDAGKAKQRLLGTPDRSSTDSSVGPCSSTAQARRRRSRSGSPQPSLAKPQPKDAPHARTAPRNDKSADAESFCPAGTRQRSDANLPLRGAYQRDSFDSTVDSESDCAPHNPQASRLPGGQASKCSSLRSENAACGEAPWRGCARKRPASRGSSADTADSDGAPHGPRPSRRPASKDSSYLRGSTGEGLNSGSRSHPRDGLRRRGDAAGLNCWDGGSSSGGRRAGESLAGTFPQATSGSRVPAAGGRQAAAESALRAASSLQDRAGGGPYAAGDSSRRRMPSVGSGASGGRAAENVSHPGRGSLLSKALSSRQTAGREHTASRRGLSSAGSAATLSRPGRGTLLSKALSSREKAGGGHNALPDSTRPRLSSVGSEASCARAEECFLSKAQPGRQTAGRRQNASLDAALRRVRSAKNAPRTSGDGLISECSSLHRPATARGSIGGEEMATPLEPGSRRRGASAAGAAGGGGDAGDAFRGLSARRRVPSSSLPRGSIDEAVDTPLEPASPRRGAPAAGAAGGGGGGAGDAFCGPSARSSSIPRGHAAPPSPRSPAFSRRRRPSQRRDPSFPPNSAAARRAAQSPLRSHSSRNRGEEERPPFLPVGVRSAQRQASSEPARRKSAVAAVQGGDASRRGQPGYLAPTQRVILGRVERLEREMRDMQTWRVVVDDELEQRLAKQKRLMQQLLALTREAEAVSCAQERLQSHLTSLEDQQQRCHGRPDESDSIATPSFTASLDGTLCEQALRPVVRSRAYGDEYTGKQDASDSDASYESSSFTFDDTSLTSLLSRSEATPRRRGRERMCH